MIPQSVQIALIGLLAAMPGLVALYIGHRRAAQRDEEREDTRAQRDLVRHLQEQIDAAHKTIRFLSARVDDLELARAKEYVETESLRDETERLRQEVRELWQGVRALIAQIEAVPLTPVWQPPAKTPAKPGRLTGDLAALRDRISEKFSIEEINDLAFRLGADPEDLVGESRQARARSLVNRFKSLDRIDELRGLCAALRPDGGF